MIEISNGKILYNLNWLENIGAFGRDPEAKLENLVSVTRSEHPWTREVLRVSRGS